MTGTTDESKRARRFLKMALLGYAAALLSVGAADMMTGSDATNTPPEAIAFVESDADAEAGAGE